MFYYIDYQGNVRLLNTPLGQLSKNIIPVSLDQFCLLNILSVALETIIRSYLITAVSHENENQIKYSSILSGSL